MLSLHDFFHQAIPGIVQTLLMLVTISFCTFIKLRKSHIRNDEIQEKEIQFSAHLHI